MTEAQIKQALADLAQNLRDGMIRRREYIRMVAELKEAAK